MLEHVLVRHVPEHVLGHMLEHILRHMTVRHLIEHLPQNRPPHPPSDLHMADTSTVSSSIGVNLNMCIGFYYDIGLLWSLT